MPETTPPVTKIYLACIKVPRYLIETLYKNCFSSVNKIAGQGPRENKKKCGFKRMIPGCYDNDVNISIRRMLFVDKGSYFKRLPEWYQTERDTEQILAGSPIPVGYVLYRSCRSLYPQIGHHTPGKREDERSLCPFEGRG
jgi:hypothetical protein